MPSTGPDAAVIHVAVGVIEGPGGRILITRRPDHVHQGGKWEFPGGKLEYGESVQEALSRELKEELGIIPLKMSPLIRIPFHYPEKHVLLDVWMVHHFEGEPVALEDQPMLWSDRRDLHSMDFPDANRPIIQALDLPDRILITPPGLPQEELLEGLYQSLDDSTNAMVYLRGYELSDKVMRVITRRRARVIIRYDAACDQFSPVRHLTSEALMSLESRPDDLHVLVSGSCHSLEQVKKANQLGLDFIFLSPVKETSSHPDACTLGWQKFSEWAGHARMPVYALGGMGINDIKTARSHGGQGIAAITGLW